MKDQKILLIEDDPFLIDIYTTKLKAVGFFIEVVNDGEDGVVKAEEFQPSVILLDIVLPHVDGWDILSQLKIKEETKDIPVIILSNLGQKEEVDKGINFGAVKYLIKAHYTPSEVVEEVKKTLKI